ncbi:non-canonical purine NTP pyrophosphatase [Spirochaetia bacterium]|nr:non-canonical purine NTP pyrophosphatase [Spirochaetia bacterium]GHU32208.1 non-canonical purine NTP pyrophosphatase [Spirochaetia bacterium]
MRLWLATNNPHKKKEFSGILPDFSITIPADAGITFDPEETGATFLENALIKARALFDSVHEPVIADDSGLCVDALNGKPGIFSARYGSSSGKKLSDSERNRTLLSEVGENPVRTARFVCALVFLTDENRFCSVQETLEGELLHAEQGLSGFGYDPILFIPEKGCTVAELPDEEKNRISHRGKAGRILHHILLYTFS